MFLREHQNKILKFLDFYAENADIKLGVHAMKTDKLAATIFAVIIIGALFLSGCPGSPSDPIPTIQYTIVLENPAQTENGRLIWPTTASEGEKITIKAEPDRGYSVENLRVLNWAGNDIVLEEPELYTWTFTMPASNLSIRVNIEAANEVLDRELEKLETIYSDWIGINQVNARIKRMQNEGSGGTTLTTQIDRLRNIIIDDMKTEDMTKWAPADYTFASYPIDYPETLGSHITNIYFVMSENNGAYPSLPRLPPGWAIEGPATGTAEYPYGTPALRRVNLVYTIGNPGEHAPEVKHTLGLVPSAQFRIYWEQTVGRRNFEIPAYHHSDNSKTAGAANIVTTDGKLNWTGDVGTDIYTKITTTGTGTGTQKYTITVPGQQGYVRARYVNGGNQVSTGEEIKNLEAPIYFIPQSRVYRIDVSLDLSP
jgi:hypothetical protein